MSVLRTLCLLACSFAVLAQTPPPTPNHAYVQILNGVARDCKADTFMWYANNTERNATVSQLAFGATSVTIEVPTNVHVRFNIACGSLKKDGIYFDSGPSEQTNLVVLYTTGAGNATGIHLQQIIYSNTTSVGTTTTVNFAQFITETPGKLLSADGKTTYAASVPISSSVDLSTSVPTGEKYGSVFRFGVNDSSSFNVNFDTPYTSQRLYVVIGDPTNTAFAPQTVVLGYFPQPLSTFVQFVNVLPVTLTTVGGQLNSGAVGGNYTIDNRYYTWQYTLTWPNTTAGANPATITQIVNKDLSKEADSLLVIVFDTAAKQAPQYLSPNTQVATAGQCNIYIGNFVQPASTDLTLTFAGNAIKVGEFGQFTPATVTGSVYPYLVLESTTTKQSSNFTTTADALRTCRAGQVQYYFIGGTSAEKSLNAVLAGYTATFAAPIWKTLAFINADTTTGSKFTITTPPELNDGWQVTDGLFALTPVTLTVGQTFLQQYDASLPGIVINLNNGFLNQQDGKFDITAANFQGTARVFIQYGDNVTSDATKNVYTIQELDITYDLDNAATKIHYLNALTNGNAPKSDDFLLVNGLTGHELNMSSTPINQASLLKLRPVQQYTVHFKNARHSSTAPLSFYAPAGRSQIVVFAGRLSRPNNNISFPHEITQSQIIPLVLSDFFPTDPKKDQLLTSVVTVVNTNTQTVNYKFYQTVQEGHHIADKQAGQGDREVWSIDALCDAILETTLNTTTSTNYLHPFNGAVPHTNWLSVVTGTEKTFSVSTWIKSQDTEKNGVWFRIVYPDAPQNVQFDLFNASDIYEPSYHAPQTVFTTAVPTFDPTKSDIDQNFNLSSSPQFVLGQEYYPQISYPVGVNVNVPLMKSPVTFTNNSYATFLFYGPADNATAPQLLVLQDYPLPNPSNGPTPGPKPTPPPKKNDSGFWSKPTGYIIIAVVVVLLAVAAGFYFKRRRDSLAEEGKPILG